MCSCRISEGVCLCWYVLVESVGMICLLFYYIISPLHTCTLFHFIIELRQGIRPAYLALILGLVLQEEIANAWINASMLVWGMPSISAYALTQPITIDWPKQLLLLTLSISAVLQPGSQVQHITTLIGIGWACCVLVANVGARAWRHLKLKPLPYRGFGRTLASFVAAIITGLSIPYIGFRQAQSGGQVALETVLIGSIIVAAVFIVSDFDAVQEFIILGSEVRICMCGS